jgi:drug/metabolite transporter (DMT)-like permease
LAIEAILPGTRQEDGIPTVAKHRGRPAGGLSALYEWPILLLVLAELFWSGNFVVGRAVHGIVPPVALAFWRWTGGLIIVLPFSLRHLRGGDLRTLLRHWPIVLALSATGIAAYNTLIYLGLQATTAINALLMQSTMPLIILLCCYLLYRDRPSRVQLVGVVLSLIGVIAIITRGSPLSLLSVPLDHGDVWVFAAVLAYAHYSALLRRRPAVHPLSLLAVTFAIGSAMIAPFYLWEGSEGVKWRLDLAAASAIAYVALFPSVIAYFAYNRGVELIGANRAGQFMHLMPFFGSILAIALLGESFRRFHLVGAVLIFAGIALANAPAASLVRLWSPSR